MTQFSPVNWTFDIFPDDHRYLTFLKKVYRHEFRKNGFRRISTSILEKKEYIEKSWFFNDFVISGEDFDLNQNPSSWVFRAYLNNEVFNEIQPVYYYYMQQIHKKQKDWSIKSIETIWADIIGENDPVLDAIQIYLNYTVLKKIWLDWKIEIKVNSIWVEKEKIKYREELVTFYDNKRHLLTQESQDLIDIDPMMILNSQEEDEKILNESVPPMAPKFLKKDSKAHYLKFKEYLDLLEVPYTEDKTLVWDSSVQTNTVWQINNLEWEVITKWYRYNSIAKNLWESKDIPATGFYTDTMLLVKMLSSEWIKIKNKDRIDLFFVQLWDEAKSVVLPLSIKAREAWINTVVSLWTPSMKEQILKAQRSNAKYIVMVGIMEARNGIFQVRNEVEWTQAEVKKEDLIDYIISKIWEENLDFYSPERDLIIKKED